MHLKVKPTKQGGQVWLGRSDNDQVRIMMRARFSVRDVTVKVSRHLQFVEEFAVVRRRRRNIQIGHKRQS